MANQTNGNQFRDDEIIILDQLRDGKWVKNIFSKIGGRSWERKPIALGSYSEAKSNREGSITQFREEIIRHILPGHALIIEGVPKVIRPQLHIHIPL